MRKIALVLCMFGLMILAGCQNKAIEKGTQDVTSEIHHLISDYLIKESGYQEDTDQQAESHEVFGTTAQGQYLVVYLWSLMEGFNQETGLEVVSGQSMPLTVKLLNDGGNYQVSEVIYPVDGEGYGDSLKEMFPKKYYQQLMNESVEEQNERVNRLEAENKATINFSANKSNL